MNLRVYFKSLSFILDINPLETGGKAGVPPPWRVGMQVLLGPPLHGAEVRASQGWTVFPNWEDSPSLKSSYALNSVYPLFLSFPSCF